MVKIFTKQILQSCALLLLLCASTFAVAQEVEVSVDRSELIRGETFVLTIRVHGQQGGVQMNMDPLRENFDIILTRTSSQLRSVNNQTESWTDYMITLFPRNTGELQIPALDVAGSMTNPLTVNVLPQTQTALSPGQTLYMETVINKEDVYVQEQLLFSIRLYYTINGIRNPQFTELDMDNAVIQMIGSPNQYERLIDGQRYGVYEKQYVIFPQRSGELQIPDIVFRGEVTDGSSAFVFRNMNTRTITAFSEGYSVQVRERPESFPGNTWLPATDIMVTESWSSDPTQLRVGDTINRTVTVSAYGLDGAALPPLQRDQIDKLNLYPEPPQIGRTFIDGNIVGSRTETYSMVAIESGSVVIPELNLPWWDVNNDELRTATLPVSFLLVAPAPGSTPALIDPAQQTTTDEPASTQIERGTPPQIALADDLVTPATTPPWIMGLTVLLAAALMLGWYIWQRRSTPVLQAVTAAKFIAPSSAYAHEISDNQESQAFKGLEKACAECDAARIRLAVIAWARQFYQDVELYTLDHLIQRSDNPELQEICLQIQTAIYGKYEASDSHTAEKLRSDAQKLLSLIGIIRKQRVRTQAQQRRLDSYALPPLYKI